MTDQLPVRTYVAAGGIVVEPDQEQILILSRPKRLGPDAQPEIRLPKGHAEPDESYDQTALREVKEESGVSDLQVLADLGQQVVEFNWQGHHYIRQEHYFLMMTNAKEEPGPSEAQFQREWVSWDKALAQLTFGAEREWVRRAQEAWKNFKQSGAET